MNQDQKEAKEINFRRRRFLKAATTAGADTALGAVALPSISNLSDKQLEDILPTVPETLTNGGESPLPNYDVVPLRSDVIGVAPIQSNIKFVHVKEPNGIEPVIKENLDNALKLIDCSIRYGGRGADLVAFSEFFLTGFQDDCTANGEGIPWTAEDFLKVARTIPGEETDRLGEKAKQYNIYIVGCTNTKEDEWPGHHFHTSFMIGPNGKVIHKHWKETVMSVVEWATTAHTLLDEFVKRYGWDAIWPVARTDIENIATMICAEGAVPETWRALAMRGAEIYAYMMASGWGARERIQNLVKTMSAVNNCYSIYCQPAKALNAKIHSESCYCSTTFIVDNQGRIMREATFDSEGCISDVIPIAQHRKRRSIPTVRTSLYRDIYTNSKYERIPPNLYLKYHPKDGLDAARYAKENARW